MVAWFYADDIAILCHFYDKKLQEKYNSGRKCIIHTRFCSKDILQIFGVDLSMIILRLQNHLHMMLFSRLPSNEFFVSPGTFKPFILRGVK